MDVRLVESAATSGPLNTPGARINPDLEVVSLIYDEIDKSLVIVDDNTNYSIAMFANNGTNLYKKVFLTYNGFSCTSNILLETVVMESNSTTDPAQRPGFLNSNEWEYFPSEWRVPSNLLEMTDPNDYSTYPYDVREGFTVVKQFLTSQANIQPGDPAYTAFYRAPHLISFQMANVESNRVYTDGWYTSYVAVTPAYETYTGPFTEGQILYSTTQEDFYVNLTGEVLIVDPLNPDAHLPWNDLINWQPAPTFEQWQYFMRMHVDAGLPNERIYFIETQHLVTVDLTAAIRKELLKGCDCCLEATFGSSKIEMYMRLEKKRMGAFVQFNNDLYHEAQKILESARKACYLCLYHDHQGEGCKTC